MSLQPQRADFLQDPLVHKPRTQIIGFQGPSTIILVVFGPYNLIIWVIRQVIIEFYLILSITSMVVSTTVS